MQPELISLFTSAISAALLLLLFIQIWRQRTSHLTDLINALLIIMMGLLIENVVIMISSYDYLYLRVLNENAMYALGYLLHLLLWMVGYNYYLRRIIRLSPEKLERYDRVNLLIRAQIILLIILVGSLLFYIRASEVSTWPDYPETAFVAISQLSILSFLYFIRLLREEEQRNRSMLIKARLYLFQWAIAPQILQSVVILIGAFLIFSFLPYSNSVVLGVVFVSINIISIVIALALFFSIDLPDFIREKYNIGSKRFTSVTRLQSYGTVD